MRDFLKKFLVKYKQRGVLGLFFIFFHKIGYLFYLAEIKNIIGRENIGRNCYFDNDIYVKCKNVKVGDNVYIGRNVVLWGKGRIIIGAGTRISDHVSIFADKEVRIGQECSIASFSYIIDSNHQVRRDKLIHHQLRDSLPIEIGNDVWIAASCVIMAGSKIEDGAVIGANSVVSGKIPSYSIALGYPARPIKNRE